MLGQILVGIVMIICMIIVLLAYREGIRTGLSLQSNKLPPITPKAIKEEKKEFEQAIKKEEEKMKETEKMNSDVTEAFNIKGLYKEVNNDTN